MKWFILLLAFVVNLSCDKKTKTEVAAAIEQTTLNFDEMTPKSLVATPSEIKIAAGESLTLSLTGIFPYKKIAILTQNISWTSADPSVLTIDKDGRARAIKPGQTVVDIQYQDLVHKVPVLVGEASAMQLILLPNSSTMALSSVLSSLQPKEFSLEVYALLTNGELQSIDSMVEWESSDPQGLEFKSGSSFTAKKPGNYEIVARMDKLQSRHRVTVTSIPKAVAKLERTVDHTIVRYGDRFALPVRAVMNDSEIITNLSGASITPSHSLLEVTGSQIFAGVLGKHTLKIEFGGSTITVPITVEEAEVTSIAINPASFPFALGQRRAFTATATFSNGASLDISSVITASVGDLGVASVANREVLATGNGSTLLTVSYRGRNKSALINVGQAILGSLDIRPPSFSLPAGDSAAFQVFGIYTDGQELDLTSLVTSRGLAPTKADVTTPGVLLAKFQGSTKLSATYVDPITGVNLAANATITIEAAYLQSLVFDPLTSSKALGRSTDFRVKGRYSDNTEVDVTPLVRISADVTSAGLSHCAGIALTSSNQVRVTGLNLGSQKIIASYGGLTGEALFTATAKELDRVEILRLDTTVAPAQIEKGQTARFYARGTFSDLSTENLTQSAGGRTVTWTPPNPALATFVDNGSEKTFAAVFEGDASFTVSVVDSVGTTSGSFAIGIFIPCSSPGLRVDYFCWYLGAIAANCTATCSAVSRGYHLATKDYLGSSGTDERCQDMVETTFGALVDATFNANATAPAALGCSIYDESSIFNIGIREETLVTNEGDSHPSFRRICSCE